MLQSILLLASLAVGSFALPQPPTFSCGSDSPPAELVEQVQRLQAESAAGTAAPERALALTIDTYVHIVTTRTANGTVTESQLAQQV